MPYFVNVVAEVPVAQVSGTDPALAVRSISQANSSSMSFTSSSLGMTQLLPTNPARLQATFYNNVSKGNLYLQLGVGPSGSYTIKMAPQSFYELSEPIHTGPVQGYWDSIAGGGAVLITEFV